MEAHRGRGRWRGSGFHIEHNFMFHSAFRFDEQSETHDVSVRSVVGA